MMWKEYILPKEAFPRAIVMRMDMRIIREVRAKNMILPVFDNNDVSCLRNIEMFTSRIQSRETYTVLFERVY